MYRLPETYPNAAFASLLQDESCALFCEAEVDAMQEPADPANEVYQHPNVIATPHTGVSSTEVLEQLVHVICENIVRQREGMELLHRLC